MLYNYQLFVLRIVSLSYKCLLRIIISYLKPYNCMQTNEYYYIEIITWNHITMCKLFVLDRNTWYITVCKKNLKNQLHKKI